MTCRNVKAIRIAIIRGTSLKFIIYCVWLLIIFGAVPNEGAHGLQEALICDIPATECLLCHQKFTAILLLSFFTILFTTKISKK
ncbi:aromatic amino acid transport family protein [Candidatus Protochlamydia sp. W-9]|uniref:aromatic amino acid transport family protein n=1 Tax=Candidatus Protochlamydia sp. W-9 TaxID=1785087 RepID=UPI00096A296A|nr:aromatic amino acid transport family protein [Candidatus Protochlamydia sp. W-9]